MKENDTSGYPHAIEVTIKLRKVVGYKPHPEEVPFLVLEMLGLELKDLDAESLFEMVDYKADPVTSNN